MNLQELESSGDLVRQDLSTGEVARFRASIQELLADAGNKTNSSQTRLGLAYSAILKCALLALRIEGYRTKSKQGHHRVALETLAETLGVDDKDIDYFLELSRTRSDQLYEAMPATDSDAADAVRAATELAENVNNWTDYRLGRA